MGVSVLHKAVYSGNAETVRVLIKRGALMNLQSPSNGNTPIHDALYFKPGKDLSVIKALLEGGANLSIRNRAGLTPVDSAKLLKDRDSESLFEGELKRRFSQSAQDLMAAVKKKDLKKVGEILRKPGAPLEERDEQGFTPLMWASREGYVEIVNALLAKNADPNALDQWMGANSGHKAAFWGRAEVLKILASNGLDLNARGGYNGYTALHDAVAQAHVEAVKVLVQAGARTDIRGHDGKTPLDIAKQAKRDELVQLLKSAKPPSPLSP
jgi:ankyrin repeat protein